MTCLTHIHKYIYRKHYYYYYYFSFFVDTIKNKQNETEQLKIIPDPRPGSMKETHLFRKLEDSALDILSHAVRHTSKDDVKPLISIPGYIFPTIFHSL